jgi:2-polyprenyl-3-methyl-5-hydroxy-6-metoxy-1,4-benzoquinol methylase
VYLAQINSKELGRPSADDQTQKWYFEQWHQYQRKKTAIQWLYFDVLEWASKRLRLNLLDGNKAFAMDVGSAHGYVAGLLCKLGYVSCACELSKYYANTYTKKNSHNVIICDAQILPIVPNKIQVITAFELVEHLPKAALFLADCFNALKDRGTLILTTPNAALKKTDIKYWKDFVTGAFILNSHNLEGHCYEFASKEELKQALEAAGFRNVCVETWWFAPVSPTIFNRYIVGRMPLFTIPHFRCVATK